VTTVYYQGAFGTTTAPNLGLVLIGTLVFLMVFLEMSRPQDLQTTAPTQVRRTAPVESWLACSAAVRRSLSS